jgi:hypothetical protein
LDGLPPRVDREEDVAERVGENCLHYL